MFFVRFMQNFFSVKRHYGVVILCEN